MIQKRVSLTEEQIKFICAYSQYGFKDQSEFIREALNEFINKLTYKLQQEKLRKEAEKFFSLYAKHNELTFLTDLDYEEFYEST
jgi:Arc/MetJ-type ribon-helix-helix transcriptional regulator